MDDIEVLVSKVIEIISFEKDHEDSNERLVLIDMSNFLKTLGALSAIASIGHQQGDNVAVEASVNLMTDLVKNYDNSIAEFNHGQTIQ